MLDSPFSPPDPFSSVLCAVPWKADLFGLQERTPLPSGFQSLLAKGGKRANKRTGERDVSNCPGVTSIILLRP